MSRKSPGLATPPLGVASPRKSPSRDLPRHLSANPIRQEVCVERIGFPTSQEILSRQLCGVVVPVVVLVVLVVVVVVFFPVVSVVAMPLLSLLA